MRQILVYGLETTHTRALRCIEGISDDDARRLPGGLTPIVWQVGHIALTDFGFARRADSRASAPDGYEAAYPPLADVRDAMNHAQEALLEVARSADLDAKVDARSYGTVGEMLA